MARHSQDDFQVGAARPRPHQDIAPLLSASKLLSRLGGGKVVTLELGVTAGQKNLDIRGLQREVFDLLSEGKLLFPEDPEDLLWSTRILVELLARRFTARIGEDVDWRGGKQRRGAERVDDLGRYAKARSCRRNFFYRAYGYHDLIPADGCRKCDVFTEPFDPSASRYRNRPPLGWAPNGFYSEAVYAKEDSARLISADHADRTSEPLIVEARWNKAIAVMKRARRELRDVVVIFADVRDPERLTHWGVLRSVRIDRDGTTYRFSHLAPLKNRRASRLRLVSTGGPMTRKHAYSLVDTPKFVG